MTERHRGEEPVPPAERRAEEAASERQRLEEEVTPPEEQGGEEVSSQIERREEEGAQPEVKRPPKE